MNFEPSEPSNLANTQNLDSSLDSNDWEQMEDLVEKLLEQERTKIKSPSSEELAKAIANILPAAIEAKIRSNPEAIAKAIAPEIALSIREQIMLDEEAIPQTLGPEMGKAIKAQIESEKDAMVDALYPVIGSTIAKYMVEVVQDINRKVESTLSPEGIKRKFQAKMQGVSEAELIFKESIGYRVRAIFLIEKDSGLVIQEIQIAGEKHLDADMLAGMLTAIRSFANDCIVSDSELDSIDYGDWQIPIEVAGYCYLAVIVAGEPPKEFIARVRRVLGEIVLEYGEEIQNFNGDLAKVPFGVRSKLEQLIEEGEKPTPRQSSSPILLLLLIAIVSSIFIPVAGGMYRARVAQRIEQQAEEILYSIPELSVYRLETQVGSGKLTVTGRVPTQERSERAELAMRSLARENNLELDNQIFTVDVPVDPSLTAGEIQRLTNLFARQPEVEISTTYQPPILKIRGAAPNQSSGDIVRAFSQIPGVEQVIFELTQPLPKIEQRLYFNSGSIKLDRENQKKIEAVGEILQRYPQIHVKLIAHSDGIGTATINQKLSRERCKNIKTALVARGIESSRLEDSCDLLSFSQNQDNHRTARSKRYVSFEPFIPLKPSQ